jgi:hypothetical protein
MMNGEGFRRNTVLQSGEYYENSREVYLVIQPRFKLCTSSVPFWNILAKQLAW